MFSLRRRSSDRSAAGAAEAERKKRLEDEPKKGVAPTPAGNVLPGPPPPEADEEFPPEAKTSGRKPVPFPPFRKVSSRDAEEALARRRR